MNYYLDTEFNEDHYKPLFGRRRHFIDLISIALVAEDGREYYAVSKDFDLKAAWNKHDLRLGEMGEAPIKEYWLRENVLRSLHAHMVRHIHGDMKNNSFFYNLSTFSYRSLKSLISMYGKTNDQIAAEIQCFTAGLLASPGVDSSRYIAEAVHDMNKKNPPTFYAYYADYDWVVFCSLFGKMIDLPKGYPYYCRDLKQMMDYHGLYEKWANKPKQVDEHHALADANWNKKLHAAIIESVADQFPLGNF
jgi:hypothetical protein